MGMFHVKHSERSFIMTALPTSKGYKDVTPTDLETLVVAHSDDKINVAYTGTDPDTGDCLYTVRWKE